ncbi:MAG: hypothetical protein AAF211_22605, partial [Myxococcota bacterium]
PPDPCEAVAEELAGRDQRIGRGDAPPPPDLAVVGELLDQPGDTPFDAAQERLIGDALRARQIDEQGTLSPAETETVARLLRDPRVADAFAAVQLAEDDPVAGPALLPALVDRVALPVPARRPHTHSRVAHYLIDLPPEALAPFADRLAAAVRDDGGWGTSGLLVVLPLFDDAPLDLVERALGSPNRTVRRDAMLAACNVTPGELPETLAQRLVTVGAEARETQERAAAVRALRRHGLPDDGPRAGLDPREVRRVDTQVDRFAGAPPEGGCRP